MPLEIRELHIKAVVGLQPDRPRPPRTPGREDEDREALVAACVEQVLDILHRKQER